MKLARMQTTTGPRFAVGDGTSWSFMDAAVTDLPAAIEASGIEAAGDIPAAGKANGGRLLCPIVSPTKVVGIGLNYLDHIRETGANRPNQPVVFSKFPNALSGPQDPISVDRGLTNAVDYEIELGVVIGRTCRAATAHNALNFVFGYVVANDLSPRDLQRTDPQLTWAKSVDGFCPVGPWITTADDIPDPQALGIRSFVNGEPRQASTTHEMLYSVAELIAFLSKTMTLLPGDLILTGTPHGVGFTMDPPKFLVDGDVVRGEIDVLGEIENVIKDQAPVAAV